MFRTVILFLLGALAGGVLMLWLTAPQPTPAVFSRVVGTPSDDSCPKDLEAARAELQVCRQQAHAALLTPLPTAAHEQRVTHQRAGEGAPHAEALPRGEEAIQWKVSAIEKFVQLEDGQRQRLKEKFERESSVPEGSDAHSESLEDILGEENARFYREQVKAAFDKERDESMDREIVWLSRQLALSPEQERSMREVFDSVEKQLEGDTAELGEQGRTPQQRVKAMIAKNRKRAELRQAQLKAVLSPEQYEVYVRTQSESSEADVELFHG
jgi:hypothetical protein